MQKISIIIDTREQTPWHFPSFLASVSRGTLRTGDYALAGDEFYAIERKSLDDFAATISSGWERFKRELDRMDLMDAKTIIVEASINDIINHDYNHPKISPAFVLKRIAELSLGSASVLLCDNSVTSAGMCYVILRLRAQNNAKNQSESGENSIPESGKPLDDIIDRQGNMQGSSVT